jgi:sugar phosphate isomerase/epimerase
MLKNKISILNLVRFILFGLLIIVVGKGFSTEMDNFKPELGVCTSLTNAEMLSTHGFSFIEESVGNFLMPLKSEEEFNEKLELALQLPIPVRACNSFIPGNLKSVGPNAVHDEILQYVETAFRRARMAGIEIIVFGSGGSRLIPEGFSREEARRQFIELGKAIGPVAARYNIVVALEPLNSSEVNFINSVLEGGAIVEEIDHPNFLLLADIYHMLKEKEGPESILKYGHLIKHVHVAEHEGRAAPGTHNEDLSEYYKALKQVGYKGRISIEGRWEDMGLQAPKAIKTIRQQL